MDHFRAMALFAKLAELRSLDRAADALGVSRAEAARELRTLESQLGGPLTEPDGAGVKLTELGRRIAISARILVETARDG